MAQRAVSPQSRIVRGSKYQDFLLASLKGSTKEVDLTVVPVGAPAGSDQEVNLSVMLTEVTIGRDGFNFKGTCLGKPVSGHYDVDPRDRPRTGRLSFG